MNSAVWDKQLENFTSYRSITDYYDRYSIADNDCAASVRALFSTNFEEAKKDYKLLTELVMVLNHRMLYWYRKNPVSPMVSTYQKIFEKADNYALKHLKDNEFEYFVSVTD